MALGGQDRHPAHPGASARGCAGPRGPHALVGSWGSSPGPGSHPLSSALLGPLPGLCLPTALHRPPLPPLVPVPQAACPWCSPSASGSPLFTRPTSPCIPVTPQQGCGAAQRAELGPSPPSQLCGRHRARRPEPGCRRGVCSRACGQDYLEPCLQSAWPGARHVARWKFLPPLFWAPLRAPLWVRLPRPLPSARLRSDSIHLSHQEPWGLQLRVCARAEPRPPHPHPVAHPPWHPPRLPWPGPWTGLEGLQRRTAFPALRSCPQSKIHPVITAQDNYCAGTERPVTGAGVRGDLGAGV